jgi:hypothetical protein
METFNKIKRGNTNILTTVARAYGVNNASDGTAASTVFSV